VAKKRGNPNWGKPEVNIIPYTGESSFEEVVRKLGLSPGCKRIRTRSTCHRASCKHGMWKLKKTREYCYLRHLETLGSASCAPVLFCAELTCNERATTTKTSRYEPFEGDSKFVTWLDRI
jgi:hypothetical protein